MNDFQKTVDLSEKMAIQNGQSLDEPKKRVLRKKKTVKRAEAIDEVFKDDSNEMHQISRPTKSESDDGFYKKVSTILFFLLLVVVVYFVFFSDNKKTNDMMVGENQPGWYAVELVSGEMYYGFIDNFYTDPVNVSRVYYDYDQIDKEKKVSDKSDAIRLVKKGKETYGPSGTMYIYQIQIKEVNELKDDSKVLRAILDYEK